MRDDPSDCGIVTETTFRGVLDEFLQYELSEHEVITMVRRYKEMGEVGQGSEDKEVERLLALIQADLRRDNFSQFDKLLLALKQEDTKR